MINNAVVLDTNLVFSALIPKASQIREILFESNMDFYSPNILISEIYKHKDKLLKCSKLTESEFYLYFNGIIERITFIPTDILSTESRQLAYNLCFDVDIKDTPFVALEGLKNKGFHDFYNQ